LGAYRIPLVTGLLISSGMRLREFNILRTDSDGTTTCCLKTTTDRETAKNRIEHLSAVRPGGYVMMFSQKLQSSVMIFTTMIDVP